MDISVAGGRQIIIGNNSHVSLPLLERTKRFFSSKEYSLKQDLACVKAILAKCNSFEVASLASDFYKTNLQRFSKDVRVRGLSRNIFAKRAGVDEKVFDNNDGLYEFFVKHHMHYKFHKFPNTRPEILENGEARLLVNNHPISWSELKPRVQPKGDLAMSPNDVSGKAYYTHNGIVKVPDKLENINLEKANLDQLKSCAIRFDKEPPTGKYLVTIRLEAANHPRLSQDHPSIKLKTPEGDVYSFGLYRQLPSFLTHGAILHMVEPGEFYTGGGEVKEVDISATEKQWEKILRTLLIDRKEDITNYELMKNNCTKYLCDLLRDAGVANFHTRLYGFHYIIQSITDAVEIVPGLNYISKNICDFHKVSYDIANITEKIPVVREIIAVTINFFVYVRSQANKVDKTWVEEREGRFTKRHPKPEPYMKFWDIFKPEKVYVNSPWWLRKYQNEIENWRKIHKDKPYGIPKKFECQRS